MGLTYVEEVVAGPTGNAAPVRLLVDSGATYTLLPLRVWQQIGLTTKRMHTFTLADGTEVEREVSECHITLEQGDGQSPAFLGREGDEPLLGAVMLEILGLVLNPFSRTLHPMRLMLA